MDLTHHPQPWEIRVRCRGKETCQSHTGSPVRAAQTTNPSGTCCRKSAGLPRTTLAEGACVCGGKHQLRRRPPLPCTLCAPRNTGSTQEGDPLSTSTTPTHWVDSGWARVLPVTPQSPPPLRPMAQNLELCHQQERGVLWFIHTLTVHPL